MYRATGWTGTLRDLDGRPRQSSLARQSPPDGRYLAEVSSELRNQLQWIVGTQLALLAIVVALVIAFA